LNENAFGTDQVSKRSIFVGLLSFFIRSDGGDHNLLKIASLFLINRAYISRKGCKIMVIKSKAMLITEGCKSMNLE
jgi:hypothetical protein